MAIKQPIVVSPGVLRLCVAVDAAGGRALVVGGTVRDAVLGRESADIDLEVHGLSVRTLRELLSGHGRLAEVGRSFGVFKLKLDGVEVDVALPRADSSAGDGVSGDPHIGVEAAARRRDLTINAMAWDPLSSALVDPLGGARDAEARVLRAADPGRFGEDPLRVWRVARFSGVLGFSVHPELAVLCRGLDTRSVPAERVSRELEKLLLMSPRPSLGWAAALEVGAAAAWVPGLAADRGAALDRAAGLRDAAGRAPRSLALMLTVLLCEAPDPASVLDRLGILRRQRFPLRDQILAGVRASRGLAEPVASPVLTRLAEQAEVGLCCLVSQACWPAGAGAANLLQAAMLGVSEAPLPPLIGGRDLVAMGVPAGPGLGPLLAAVREAQLEGDIHDRDAAIELAGRLLSERSPGA